MLRNRAHAIAFALAAGALSAHAVATTAEEQARTDALALAVPSPYRITDAALAGKIRYVLVFQGTTRAALPETGEQHVEQEGERFVVTICADHCGREPRASAADLKRYLRPNAWVQSMDGVIAEFARISPSSFPVRRRMPELVRAVEERMTGPITYLGFGTARDAHDHQSGDCTESAILLAAAARARGIPTRVVGGLAYASRFLGGQHVFGPHMWVQSWDGDRWVSYDAGLGDFDAGHIALVIGDGTPADFEPAVRMIRAMRIERAVGLVKPPATPMPAR